MHHTGYLASFYPLNLTGVLDSLLHAHSRKKKYFLKFGRRFVEKAAFVSWLQVFSDKLTENTTNVTQNCQFRVDSSWG
jgi:hypothetical protein